MEITIHNTTKIVVVNGDVPARIWEGETDSGIKVECLVTRIAARKGEDLTQFERELNECAEPSSLAQAFPARMIL